MIRPPPRTTLFPYTSVSRSYDNGSGTLFFRPSTGGAFTVNAASSDAQSGIKSCNAHNSLLSLNTNGGGNLGSTKTAGALAVTFDGTSTGPTSTRTVSSTNKT